MAYMFRDFRKFSRYRAFIRSFEIPSNYAVLVSGFPKGMRGVGDPKTADVQLGNYFRTFFEEKVKYGTVSSACPALIATLIRRSQLASPSQRAKAHRTHRRVQPSRESPREGAVGVGA